MRIAFFGHDASDAMLARRIAGMKALGHDVTAFTMRRDEDRERGWKNVDLGRTYDAKLMHRALSIRRGIRQCRDHPRLSGMDLYWARNLDMLAIAVAARRDAGSHAPLVYETLDIHGALTAKGPKGWLFRRAEKRLLEFTRLIVVSSPAFVTEYYDKVHAEHPVTALTENTLPISQMPPRPALAPRRPGPFRLGWVGILRCERSFHLLQAAAREFGGELEVILHGKPAHATVPDFEARVEATPNMRYEGPYRSPDDLPRIYGDLDAVWAAVTSDAHANAQWLLPNRIYEGGYFGVPALAIEGTETGRFLTRHGTGEAIPEPLDVTLPQVLRRRIAEKDDPTPRRRVLETPDDVFARGTEDLARALDKVTP